jgi:hypothetical protein
MDGNSPVPRVSNTCKWCCRTYITVLCRQHDVVVSIGRTLVRICVLSKKIHYRPYVSRVQIEGRMGTLPSLANPMYGTFCMPYCTYICRRRFESAYPKRFVCVVDVFHKPMIGRLACMLARPINHQRTIAQQQQQQQQPAKRTCYRSVLRQVTNHQSSCFGQQPPFQRFACCWTGACCLPLPAIQCTCNGMCACASKDCEL